MDKAIIKPELLQKNIKESPSLTKWKRFMVTDLFKLHRGHFHSIADLDPGNFPTISRVSTDNGFVGVFDKPNGASVWPQKTITVSSVTGDAFIQPIPFIATDNVVLCVLKPYYQYLRLTSLLFIQSMMNSIKWRYSYGRQCYKTKYSKTEIPLPINIEGALDEDFMAAFVKGAKNWPIVKAAFE